MTVDLNAANDPLCPDGDPHQPAFNASATTVRSWGQGKRTHY